MTNGISFVMFGLSVALGLAALQPAEANDNFRSFVEANPGIDRAALRHMWQSSRSGNQSGIGFGVIGLNGAAGRSSVPPVVDVTMPSPVVPGSISTFRDFKNSNPGIDNRVLREAWRADLTQMNIGFIRSNAGDLTSIRPGKSEITFTELKNLNPGIDRSALRAMYKHMKNGAPADVTFGVITDADSISSGSSQGNLLANSKAFGNVRLLTDK